MENTKFKVSCKNKKGKECFFCGYIEKYKNLEVEQGIYLCDECLLQGRALDLPKIKKKKKRNGRMGGRGGATPHPSFFI